MELPVTARQLRWEAAGVVSVELAREDGGALPEWRPGAHVELVLPTGISRQYSLCGSPDDRSSYRIGVRRDPRSRGGSEYVHTFLRPGQTVRIRGPRDNFGFSRAEEYLFIAGGIGITPILPMARQAAEWGVPWRLAYGGHTADSMAFRAELEALGPFGFHASDRTGRLPLTELLEEPRGAVYACGPEPLLEAVEKGTAHWPAGSLHLERFKPRPRPPRPDTAVEVVCARSARTVPVPADRSVLRALEDAGLPVEGSCREGVCGTCRTKVLEGVPDHRDDILSEDEQARGDVMFPCVSRALTPKLVLDV
ncbi:PDR/VanB family oxidoreductase [Amycolatopsis sp. NBC_00345]|uniref:PDR/VanB family oxidoreductase n=1 Tax=Amycolatopsis sp. NBC_00345 TaxID=2975955 RepID=UPI002E26370B